MPSAMIYVHAITPLHTSLGQATGFIDLPIQREKLTGWPIIPGSTIKGVLRSACESYGIEPRGVEIAFGPETENASDHAGGLMFGALRLLALPVRSAKGLFAWVTSPMVLRRWARDTTITIPAACDTTRDHGILLPSETAAQTIGTGRHLTLEDCRLSIGVIEELESVAEHIATATFPDPQWQTFFLNRFGLVSDTMFTHLARTATDITMRNRIDDTRKVVARSQLWLEESLPAESILAGPLTPTRLGLETMRPAADASRAAGTSILLSAITDCLHRTFQIGGNETVGRGLAHIRLAASRPNEVIQ